MKRRALLVGINVYDDEEMDNLAWCIEDVFALMRVLETHEDNSTNFDCHILLGAYTAAEELDDFLPRERVTFNRLRSALEDLFNFDGMVLFYFSGHGYPKEDGVHLVTQDGTDVLPGIALSDILDMVNESQAREVILLIDSCHSGAFAEPNQDKTITTAYIRPGVTLLAASRSQQPALEKDGHGLFTNLVIGALNGGASDVRGQVSAASIYAYVEQALGPWEQRPIYKSNATELSPLRYCKPDIEDEDLRRLPQFFSSPNAQYSLDPSYESTRPECLPEHIAIFKLFKRYQVARLLRPTLEDDLYFTALRHHPVELTQLGKFYWRLAKSGLLGKDEASHHRRRIDMPDAEAIAKLFHETYERLAPSFNYETREATRQPWEQVPERNKRLMVAVAAEVLATLFPPENQDVTQS